MNSRLISCTIALMTMITTTLFNIDIANSSPNSEHQLCIIPCFDEVIGPSEYYFVSPPSCLALRACCSHFALRPKTRLSILKSARCASLTDFHASITF